MVLLVEQSHCAVRRRRLARTAHTSAQLCENKRTYDEMSCVCDLVLVPSLSWQLIVYVFIAPTKRKTICWHTPASGPSAPAAIASAIPATYAITSKHNVARMSFLSLRLSRACLGKSRPFLKKETKSCLKAERFVLTSNVAVAGKALGFTATTWTQKNGVDSLRQKRRFTFNCQLKPICFDDTR